MMKGGTRTAPPPSVNRMTHRYNRKHYLPATLFAGGNNVKRLTERNVQLVKIQESNQIGLFVLSSTIYFKVNPASVV